MNTNEVPFDGGQHADSPESPFERGAWWRLSSRAVEFATRMPAVGPLVAAYVERNENAQQSADRLWSLATDKPRWLRPYGHAILNYFQSRRRIINLPRLVGIESEEKDGARLVAAPTPVQLMGWSFFTMWLQPLLVLLISALYFREGSSTLWPFGLIWPAIWALAAGGSVIILPGAYWIDEFLRLKFGWFAIAAWNEHALNWMFTGTVAVVVVAGTIAVGVLPILRRWAVGPDTRFDIPDPALLTSDEKVHLAKSVYWLRLAVWPGMLFAPWAAISLGAAVVSLLRYQTTLKVRENVTFGVHIFSFAAALNYGTWLAVAEFARGCAMVFWIFLHAVLFALNRVALIGLIGIGFAKKEMGHRGNPFEILHDHHQGGHHGHDHH